MSMTWTHENPARWDADKARIVGGAKPGIFALTPPADNGLVPGEWWAVRDGDVVVGYGWMDVVWGEGEILLAVDSNARGKGVGGFIVEKLAEEAAARGLRQVHNVVRASHPNADKVTAFLLKRGFLRDSDSDRLFRKT